MATLSNCLVTMSWLASTGPQNVENRSVEDILFIGKAYIFYKHAPTIMGFCSNTHTHTLTEVNITLYTVLRSPLANKIVWQRRQTEVMQ